MLHTSLWWDDRTVLKAAEKEFQNAQKERRGSVYMSLANHSESEDLALMEESGRSFAEILKSAKTPDFRSNLKYFEDEDHGSIPLQGLYHGLKYFFKGHYLNWDSLSPASSLKEQFEDLSKRLGFDIQPSEDQVNMYAYVFLQSKEVDKAMALFQLNVLNYPESFNVHDSLGEAYVVKGQTALAIQSYEKALERSPGNTRIEKIIKELKDSMTRGESALLGAAKRGDLGMIETFEGDKEALNEKGEIGLTPWQMAMVHRRVEAAELLVKLGADDSLAFPPPGETLDKLLTSLIDENGPGIAVRVSREGKVLFEKGYGLAVIDPRTAITPETKFRIGSATKQMTASVILKLVEDGKLTFETKLSEFYPDFPRSDEVTIHHILTHSSGIKNFVRQDDFFEKMHLEVTAEEVIGSIRNEPYDFDPGTRCLYCNTGYYFLGEIAAKLHGKTFSEMMKEQLFQVCGMENSGVSREGLGLKNDSLGYSFFNGEIKEARKFNMTWTDGAGAVYSTVRDLDRWNEAIFTKGFLKPESLEKAFTVWPTKEDPKPTRGRGYGWLISDLNGVKKIWHGGNSAGWACQLVRFPDEKLSIAILSNSEMRSVPGTEPRLIEDAISHFYLWRKMKPNNLPKLDEKAGRPLYVSYAGRYDCGGPIMVVREDSGRLFAKLEGQVESEISHKRASSFFWKEEEAEVTFETNYMGKVTQAIHQQDGKTIKAKKLPQNLKFVELTDEQLEAMAGRYQIDSDVFLTVTKEGDKLFSRPIGLPRFELVSSGPLTFHCRDFEATMKFTKGDGGKVNGGVFVLFGEEHKLKRVEKAE